MSEALPGFSYHMMKEGGDARGLRHVNGMGRFCSESLANISRRRRMYRSSALEITLFPGCAFRVLACGFLISGLWRRTIGTVCPSSFLSWTNVDFTALFRNSTSVLQPYFNDILFSAEIVPHTKRVDAPKHYTASKDV